MSSKLECWIGQIGRFWHRNGSNVTVSKFDYSYDADGQIATWTQRPDAETRQSPIAF
jgi:hypothetical protein